MEGERGEKPKSDEDRREDFPMIPRNIDLKNYHDYSGLFVGNGNQDNKYGRRFLYGTYHPDMHLRI